MVRTLIILQLLLLWRITLMLLPPLVAVVEGFALTTTCTRTIPRRRAAEPLHAETTTQTRMIPVCEYHQIAIPSLREEEVVGGTEHPLPLPRQEITVHDLTGAVQDLLRQSRLTAGTVTVVSRHTTTAIAINEYESRLSRDVAETYQRLIPPDERAVGGNGHAAASSSAGAGTGTGIRYQHNDIEQRPESAAEAARCVANGWDITDPRRLQAWREQEPVNAHSHLLAMLLGNSECIPVVDATLMLGQWQSILLIDLDGPRDRTVGVQLTGFSVMIMHEEQSQ
jgi:thiamine phosphate synthase YjbQ (UPF0047 family)